MSIDQEVLKWMVDMAGVETVSLGQWMPEFAESGGLQNCTVDQISAAD
jgi:hypothetical protein